MSISPSPTGFWLPFFLPLLVNFELPAAVDVDNLDFGFSVDIVCFLDDDDGERSSSGITVVGMSVVNVSWDWKGRKRVR